MNKIRLLFCLTLCIAVSAAAQTRVPDYLKGTFADDYGIQYTINDSLWIQQPKTRFHIIKWNLKENYLIARNDSNNPTEPNLYTRIDFMQFTGMVPFLWGFCLSEYKASSDKEAEAVQIADRNNPKKGCNGFPFSRMKRTDVK